MVTLISLVAFTVVCLLFIEFRKRKNSKLGDSVLYIIIERHYKKWYSFNATIINKKATTLYEVDKILFELKRTLEKEGIQNEILEGYVDFLGKTDSQLTFGLKDVALAIMTFVSTNSFLKNLLPPINYESLGEWVKKIPNISNEHKEIVAIIVATILIIVLFVLLTWCMYRISTIDNLYINRQRYSLLKRLNKIWGYKEENGIDTVEKILEISEKEREKSVFPDLIFTKTKFEQRLEKTVGETIEDNILFVFEKTKIVKNVFEVVIDFCLSFSLAGPLFFLYIVIINNVIPNNPDVWFKIIMWISVFLLSAIFMTFYISQLNVYSKDISFEKRDSSKKYTYKLASVTRRMGSWLILFLYSIPIILLTIFGKQNYWMMFLTLFILIAPFPIRVERYEKNNQLDENLIFRVRLKKLMDMYFESWKDNTINKISKRNIHENRR